VKYKHAPTGGHEGALGEDGIEVSRTIVQTCIREGEGILSSNAQADPRFRAGDSVARYNIRSAICSPIRFQSRTFGAIYIDSSIANYTFTVEQLALMNAVGLHTALALANAEQTARRLHAERLAAMGETIASLSHSIKNILQGLRGGADVLEMGLDRADHKIARGGWDILKRNLDRIVGLTMNMLTYSRQRHVELEVTRLDRLIEDCQQLLDPLCESRGVALIVDAEPDVPPIAVDPSLIHQALMNLLTNAVEAVPPETGAVTVRLEYREAGPANPDVQRDCAEISVTDNGPGIPRDQLSWIFEPFNTTKGIKGTGLGLAVTRRILQDHRGRVRVETSEGKGSTFRLRIPADLDSASDPSETTEQLPPSGDLLRRL
jgi:signal transduction histidine kinase